MCYDNIGSRFFRFVTKHACDSGTDGQNYIHSYTVLVFVACVVR